VLVLGVDIGVVMDEERLVLLSDQILYHCTVVKRYAVCECSCVYATYYLRLEVGVHFWIVELYYSLLL